MLLVKIILDLCRLWICSCNGVNVLDLNIVNTYYLPFGELNLIQLYRVH